MRNSLKMDVLDELRLFREKRLSNSTFCAPVSYSNLNLNLNLKLESETVKRIVCSLTSLSMFSSWFMQKMVGSSSRVYCILARATNNYVLI
jgi:hypothetical protein